MNQRLAWGALALGIATGSLGCGDSTGSGTGGGGGTTTSSTGGSGGDGGGGGKLDAPARSASVGVADIAGTHVASGAFLEYPDACDLGLKTTGECTFSQLGPACQPTYVDAGTITIKSPVATTTLTVDKASKSFADPLFLPGQTVEMSGSGAEVPAFSGSVSAPPALSLTAPSFAGALSIDKAQGLTVSWPAQDGQVLVELTGVGDSPTGTYYTLSCLFDGKAGQGVVPEAALSNYPLTTADLTVFGYAAQSTTAGDWPVTLFLESEAKDAQGNPAYAPVTLQ